jgi:hypothetical protein
MVKAGGTYSYHWAVKGESDIDSYSAQQFDIDIIDL